MGVDWPILPEWRQPLWLWLLILPPLRELARHLRGRRTLTRFAQPHLHPWLTRTGAGSRRETLRRLGWTLAWLLLVVALAGPRLPRTDGPPPEPADGPALLLLLDLSPSMRTRDLSPDRRERARIALGELLHRVQGERLGLMPFSARPHLLLPPTGDREVFRFYLEVLARLELPTAGSRPLAALEAAGRRLPDAGGAVVLVTDGDFPDSDPRQLEEAVRKLAARGIPVSVLRLSTASGGTVEDAGGRLVRDGAGEAVISRPDLPLLDRLARIGGSVHRPIEPDGSHWQAILETVPAAADADEAAKGATRRWRTLHHWPLALAAGLLLLLSIPGRRGATALLLILLLPLPAPAADRHDTALGEGVARYRAGELGEAARLFREALLLADEDRQRAVALHDLGVVRYRQGDYAAAARLFGEALRHRPDLEPARHNLELATALARAVDRLEAAGGGLAERMGHGARSLRAREGLEAGDRRGSMSIDESSGEVPPLTLDRLLGQLPPRELERLLQRGVERLRATRPPATTAARPASEAAVRAARLRMEGLTDHPERVWRRLFEMEEGFEAPREGAPRKVEGVSPW